LFNKCQERFGCSEDFFGLSVSCNEGSIVIDHVALTSAGIEVVERQLHMPPSVIGQIAQQAHVKRLVLSHRMLRTLSKEAQSYRKSERTFRAPLPLQTILIASPYPKVVKLGTRFDLSIYVTPEPDRTPPVSGAE
jgi:hypothetical protein